MVAIINPSQRLGTIKNPEYEAAAKDARVRLERGVAALNKG